MIKLFINGPLEPPAQVVDVPREISTGLGVKPVWVGRNRLDYVIEVESEAQLKSLRPAQDVLASLETRGFVVTAWADDQAASGYDYVLRFFGPRVGVPEDFVTGTAHCALAPYWRDRSRGQQQSRFRAFQASARSGYVDVELRGERVFIAAQAITVLRGVLLV